MKHSKTTSKQSSLLASATEDELIVSQILLDLKSLVSLSESLANFNWGCRRRRSCLDADPPLPREPSCPPPLVQKTENEIEARWLQIKAAEVVVEKGGDATGTTASPTTPLSFSPSESDEKSKHSSKRISRKRSREDYNDIIEGLTQSKDVVRGVINDFPKKEEPQAEISGGINYGTDLAQNYRINMAPHRQLYILDPTDQQNLQYPIGPIQTRYCLSSNGATYGDRLGPLGIDLNFPAAEAFGEPLDASKAIADKRARFAEARKKRRRLMKAKSMTMRSAVVKYYQLPDNYENTSSL